MKTNNKNKGYIIKSYSGSRKLFEFFWAITKQIRLKGTEVERQKSRLAYHQFIVHIYVSTRLKSNKTTDPQKALTVPIYSPLIRSAFHGKVNIHVLKENNIIHFTNHFHGSGNGKCREFKLQEKIWRKAIQIAVDYTFTAWDDLTRSDRSFHRVDLFTGKSKKMSPMKNSPSLYTNNNKMYDIAQLVKDSINSLEPCPFNPYAIIPYCNNVKKAFLIEKRKIQRLRKWLTKRYPDMTVKERSKRSVYKKANKSFQQIQGLYINITMAMDTISAQNPSSTGIKTPDGQVLMKYPAAYRPQKSGRVSEIHGGFQNITTPCKKLLLQDVPDIFNYDLKNSQAVLLKIELKACNIPCQWLEDYINDGSMREKLAKKIGISVGCWKGCFYSVVMGSPAGGVSAVFDTIRKESKNTVTAKRRVKTFKRFAKPLIDACRQWRHHLYYSIDPRYKYKHNGYHWRNACGMTFREYITNYADKKMQLIDRKTGEIIIYKERPGTISEVKRQLPAFFLQGKEAFYIHTLTLKCKKHGIPVYKNEHDGLITGKEIPQKLWQEVAEEVNANGISLEIKDICSSSKWEIFNDKYSNE